MSAYSFDHSRRHWLRLGAAAGVAPLVAPHAAFADGAVSTDRNGRRVLRYAFPAAETGFDPAQINDLYSRIVTSHIFDGLYKYDYLNRPFLIKPNVAAGMPEVGDDFRRFTVRLRPGIFFADDPAFKGQKRELVAQDFVYSLKRIVDPANKSPVATALVELELIGLNELRERALKDKAPFPYDTPVEGLRALDRYTIQFRTRTPRPRFVNTLTGGDLFGAVAREVIEAYPGKTMEHPVGTGPFRLAQWRRSSLIVLERNPGFRELAFDGEPAPDDAEGQAIAAALRGRRLPMIDRVEVSIIDESQPRWLAFLNGQFDMVSVPVEFSTLAVPNGRIAPNLERRGIRLHRIVNPDRTLTYFNMEDPVVGGYAPERVALRRAIGLATDVEREIRLIRRGQAIPAQSFVAPGTWGYDPTLRTENGDFDPGRAKALLDTFGWIDRDGDGWREQPDGSPLEIVFASQPDALSRQFDENWKRALDAIGIRLTIRTGQWPEQLKAARAGQLMVWQLGYSAAEPDVQTAMQILYGPASGGQNLPRFRHRRFDEIYDRMQVLPDGPERLALLREAQRIVLAYMPHKYNVHRILNDLVQPWLLGYRRPLYGNQWWQYVDIDPALRGATA